MKKIKVGIIGFGRMGGKFLDAFMKNDRWEVAYICDKDPEVLSEARILAPNSTLVQDEDMIFNDPEVDAVGLFALADSRISQLEKAYAAGKHVIAEKPIADSIFMEKRAVELSDSHNVISTVNLYLRNSWYHNLIREFISQGEIGELAIIRICHMTPGLAPGEGHESEGPAFHDCGMHYVDLARWYAGSEFKSWHAQGVRMWDYKDPWWLSCHGTFHNGVVFEITQGFVYGQLSACQTHNAYVDIIGTEGIVRMTHDFKTAVVELHGVNKTLRVEHPYGGKNLDTLCALMAESIDKGVRNPALPLFKDAAIASEFAWHFVNDAFRNDLPSKGSPETLDAIHRRRATMEEGYGLIKKKKIKTNTKQLTTEI